MILTKSERASALFYTFLTLFAALAVVKCALLYYLLKENYGLYTQREAGFVVFCGLPLLISSAGLIICDIIRGRRLRLAAYILTGITVITAALELIPVMFYWCSAISALCGITTSGLSVYDLATYDKRMKKKERIEKARLEAAERSATDDRLRRKEEKRRKSKR